MLSMDHIPTGPYYNNATGNITGWHSSPIWPAWWMNGDDRSNGEFDMFEAYEPNNHASITLHDWDQSLYGNCTIPSNITQYANSSGNAFDGITQFSPNGTSLEPFNKAGGGVYVMQWDHGKFIREWTFVKPNIPADILNVSVLFIKKKCRKCRNTGKFSFREAQTRIQTLGECPMHIFHSARIVIPILSTICILY
jgi:ribosomal protein S27E